MFSFALTTALLLAQPLDSPSESPAAADVPTPASSTTAPEVKPAPSYDDLVRRIEALEKAEAARAAPPPTRSTAGVFTQNRFNPDLSIIAHIGCLGGLDHQAIKGWFGCESQQRRLRRTNTNVIQSPIIICRKKPYRVT